MHNSYFKTFKAEGAIGAYCIAKAGSVPGTNIVAASAPTDKLIGPIDNIPAVTGDDVDVNLMGQHSVKLGGTVAFWDALTSDANGAAVVSAPGTGVTHYIIGRAMKAGVAGDIIPYLGVPDTLKG